MYPHEHKQSKYSYDAWLEYYAGELEERSLFDDDHINLCALKCLKKRNDLTGLLGHYTIEALLQFLINQHTDEEENSFDNLMNCLREELLDEIWPEVERDLEDMSGFTIIGGKEIT